MAHISFIFYFILCSWLVTKINFFKNSGLNKYWLIGLFTLKVFAGILYGIFYALPSYYATSDTWHFFELSKNETDWLFRDPLSFVKDIFVYGYKTQGNLFIGNNSYWNDLKDNLIIKLMALCNVLSLKNYYTNVIILNFLYFFGPVAFFRIIRNYVNTNLLVILSIFCIPSFLFWCSGAHKDGLIFTCLALFIYFLHEQIKNRRTGIWTLIKCLFFYLLVFVLRNFLAILLVPAVFSWILIEIFKVKKIYAFAITYFVCLLLFFGSSFLGASFNMPGYIVEKQSEFKQLQGNSQIIVPELHDNIESFFKYLPIAIDISFFRPHITEVKNFTYLPAIIESYFLYGIILISLFQKPKNIAGSFFLFCIFYSLSVLLLEGYTITFSGAIVRYKSIILPMLFTPFINFDTLKKKA